MANEVMSFEMTEAQKQGLVRLFGSDDWRVHGVAFLTQMNAGILKRLGSEDSDLEIHRLQGHTKRVEIILDFSKRIIQESAKGKPI